MLLIFNTATIGLRWDVMHKSSPTPPQTSGVPHDKLDINSKYISSGISSRSFQYWCLVPVHKDHTFILLDGILNGREVLSVDPNGDGDGDDDGDDHVDNDVDDDGDEDKEKDDDHVDIVDKNDDDDATNNCNGPDHDQDLGNNLDDIVNDEQLKARDGGVVNISTSSSNSS